MESAAITLTASRWPEESGCCWTRKEMTAIPAECFLKPWDIGTRLGILDDRAGNDIYHDTWVRAIGHRAHGNQLSR